MSYDVAILGAGIVGAACARELALARLRVVVIDPAPIGSGATAAGMGHVLVLDDSDSQFALTRYSQQRWDELAPRLPDDCEHINNGTLWVAADDEEMAAVHQKHAYYQARGVATEVLDGRGVAAAEPNLRSGLAGGLRVPGDSVIYPPCAARWLIEDAQRHGAAIRLGVSAVEWRDNSIHLSDGSALNCEQAVHATGAWTRTLFPALAIRPRKGHLVITDRYPGFARHQLVEIGYLKSAHGGGNESVAFNLQPRKTGQMLLGSSRQYDVESKEIEPHMLKRMIDRALEFVPALGRLSVIRAWTGFRAATPDSLPLIGPLPGRAGHWLATGHEGLGITTSLGTAALIRAHFTGEQPAIPCEPYLPSRFAGDVGHG
jgi:glycine/D-amino acid oxidase-like deaminating enzyme